MWKQVIKRQIAMAALFRGNQYGHRRQVPVMAASAVLLAALAAQRQNVAEAEEQESAPQLEKSPVEEAPTEEASAEEEPEPSVYQEVSGKENILNLFATLLMEDIFSHQ